MGKIKEMISITKIDGKKFWLNPHMIESMECTPDLTITLISGKKILTKDSPQSVIDSIIAYRRQLGFLGNEQ